MQKLLRVHTTLIVKHFLQIQVECIPMNSKKERQRMHGFLNAETKPKVSLTTVYKTKKNVYRKKIFKGKWEWGIERKRKEGFLTALTTMIRKGWTKTKRRLVNCSHYGD